MIELKTRIEETCPNLNNNRNEELSIAWAFGGDGQYEEAVIVIGVEFNKAKLFQIKERDMEAALKRINSRLKDAYEANQCKT